MPRSDTASGPWASLDDGGVLNISGPWLVTRLGEICVRLDRLSLPLSGKLEVDLANVEVMDTAGAWLLYRTTRNLRAQGVEIALRGVTEIQRTLLEQVEANDVPCDVEPPHVSSMLKMLSELGDGAVRGAYGMRNATGFLGASLLAVFRTLFHPSRFRLTATVHQIELVGLNALPIVGLISFLIGVVIAYQGAFQLRLFGAEIFTVNLVAVSVLREFGILLSAIMVAGRSGSAFAAEIGSMKLHEEVDAMRTLALDPMEILVLPRLIALTLMMPILTFYADMMGLFGGMVISWLALDISPLQFVERAHDAVTGWDMGVGLIKAPIFGIIIALTGCYEGLMVQGSAESVGYRTTKAVVEAIFLIIVLDAFFAIFFTEIGI